MAGLQSVGAGKLVEDEIAVVLADIAPDEAALAEIAIVFRIIQDQMTRQYGQIHRRHQLPVRLRQPVGIDEMRLLEPDLTRPRVHHAHETFHRSAQRLGDHDAGIVARLDDDAADQILDRNPVADIDEHFRAAAFAPGALGYRQRVAELHPSVLQPLKQQLQRHQLAHRGGRHRRETVLGPQHLTARGFHQQRVLGAGADCGLDGRRSDRRH